MLSTDSKISNEITDNRVCKPGGGHKKITDSYSDLVQKIKDIVHPETCGDPEKALLHINLSVRKISKKLEEQGHKILTKNLVYNMQTNKKNLETGPSRPIQIFPLFHTLQVPVIGIIETMSYFQPPDSQQKYYIFGKNRGQSLAASYGIPFCGAIPLSLESSQHSAIAPELLAQAETAYKQSYREATEHLLTSLRYESQREPEEQASYSLKWQNETIRSPATHPPLIENFSPPVPSFESSSQFIAITSIWQIDEQTLAITWSDQWHMTYDVFHLRKNCPCALCDEKRASKNLHIAPSVKPTFINSLGRYALHIHFSDHHHSGIYPFSLLRKIFSSKKKIANS